MSSRLVTPQEIKVILQSLSEADAVLIGGQGINVWSCIYEKPDCEPWRSARPYTSVDADALADRAEMVRLARALEEKGYHGAGSPHRAREQCQHGPDRSAQKRDGTR